MKKIRTSYNGGSLKNFTSYLARQKNNGANFTVLSSGLSRTVILDSGIKFKFFPNDDKNRVQGAYFVNMVRSSINKYIDKHGLLDEPNDTPQVQTFNPDGIALAGQNDIMCMDLNSCYWRTANLLGYIDDDLYKKGVDSGFKMGLLISIGALNKLKHIDTYEDGKKVGSEIDEQYRRRYSPFYWKIISRVRDLMMTVYEKLEDDFYMWLTDCAFINPVRYDEVKKIFDDYGYPFKDYRSHFSYFDGINVSWYEHKSGKTKNMPISNRDVRSEHLTWKTINEFNSKINNNEN